MVVCRWLLITTTVVMTMVIMAVVTTMVMMAVVTTMVVVVDYDDSCNDSGHNGCILYKSQP